MAIPTLARPKQLQNLRSKVHDRSGGLVDGSQIEYFSDEFNELCVQVGPGRLSLKKPYTRIEV